MSNGKWITDLSGRTTVADAARRVLSIRMEVVRDYLGLALKKPDQDIEHVHQLRVGTRRASAALSIFADCVPKKTLRKAKKELRSIRRAAGRARDWDVFLQHLVSEASNHPSQHRPGLDFLYGYALGHRIPAQADIEGACGEYPIQFERLMARTISRIRSPEKSLLIDRARMVLSDLLNQLDEAISRDLCDFRLLHEVRIVGKRLRYAMEVFACCFGRSFRKHLYPAVVEMQNILGTANDSYVALQCYESLTAKMQTLFPNTWARYRPAMEDLIRGHNERLPEERRRFEEWHRGWLEGGYAAAFREALQTGSPERFRFKPKPVDPLPDVERAEGKSVAGEPEDRLPQLALSENLSIDALPVGSKEPAPPSNRDALEERLEQLKRKHAERTNRIG